MLVVLGVGNRLGASRTRLELFLLFTLTQQVVSVTRDLHHLQHTGVHDVTTRHNDATLADLNMEATCLQKEHRLSMGQLFQ